MKTSQTVALVCNWLTTATLALALFTPDWYYPAQTKVQNDTHTTQFNNFGLYELCCNNDTTDLVCKANECYNIKNDCTVQDLVLPLSLVSNCGLFISVRYIVLTSFIVSLLASIVYPINLYLHKQKKVDTNMFNTLNLVVGLHGIISSILSITSIILFSILIKNESNTIFSGLDKADQEAHIGTGFIMTIISSLFSVVYGITSSYMFIKPPVSIDDDMYRLIPESA